MQPMQPPLVIKQGTSSAPVSMQPGMVTVPMTVNSTMPGSLPNVMTLNKPGGQNVVVTTQNLGTGQPAILPNVQILNMRPGTPSVPAQKSVATVSPRVVIGTPQVVGTRAAAPGITLQTLQSLQPGQQGHLLLKTENGQYQLLRVGPAPATSALAAPPSQTIRLSTVPAHPGVATASTSVAPPGVMPAQLQGMGAPVMHAVASGSGLAPAPPPPPPHQQPTTSSYVKPSDNTKEKCRNFLANLLDLSSKEPPSVEMNVRNLIQELIDVQVEPEEFCDRLERLLNASPQPCLIGFLKKSLPLLRQSLVTKELVIDGIKPPAPHVAFAAPTMPANVQLAGAAVVDDFVFKVPTKPAPRRKRSLSASSVPKDKQYFLKSEGLATASNATEGTSKVDERYQNFLLAIEKEKAALMTLPLTFAPKEDLSKYTLVSYFQNFLSEENPEQETAIQESVVQDMYLPSEAGQAKATEAAASSKRGSSVIVVSEPIVSTTGTRKKMPLAQEKRLRGKSAGQTAPVQKNLSTLYDSDDESDEYENYFHPGYPYSPANPSGTVNLEFENITRLSLPSIEMTDVEIFEGKRIRHFNNFLNSLAEELKQLPIVVAIRLEAEIQQAVEAAKRLTYENKYISPMSSSTLSRLAGHYDFAGEDDDWYYDDK